MNINESNEIINSKNFSFNVKKTRSSKNLIPINVRLSLKIFPLILNIRSTEPEDVGTPKNFIANSARIGILC
jgi:hypothetical protein